MLVFSMWLGLASTLSVGVVSSEDLQAPGIRCFIEKGDDGFIAWLVDAYIEQQENGVPIDPELTDRIQSALVLCGLSDEYREADPKAFLTELLGAPISAELGKRLNEIGVSTERIDEIALDNDGTFLSPKEFDAESREKIRRYMGSIDVPDRRRAYIYLILYIDSKAAVSKQ